MFVKDVLEAHLGKDGTSVNIDEFREGGSPFEKIAKTGEKYDYVNYSGGFNDPRLDAAKGKEGSIPGMADAYNGSLAGDFTHRQKLPADSSKWTQEQQRKFVQFAIDHGRDLKLDAEFASTDDPAHKFSDKEKKKLTRWFSRLSGNYQGMLDLMTRGTRIFLAGAYGEEVDPLTFMKRLSGKLPGRLTVVGANAGHILSNTGDSNRSPYLGINAHADVMERGAMNSTVFGFPELKDPVTGPHVIAEGPSFATPAALSFDILRRIGKPVRAIPEIRSVLGPFGSDEYVLPP